MAAESKQKTGNGGKGKKRKQRYLPHNKPVNKGLYPLCPGVIGFFITCDGGREHQATREAINLLDRFYEELGDEDVSAAKIAEPCKPLNKIIKFINSDSSGSDNDLPALQEQDPSNLDHENAGKRLSDETMEKNLSEVTSEKNDADTVHVTTEDFGTESPPTKKQRVDTIKMHPDVSDSTKPDKYIDELLEAELDELGDRTKRRFLSLDSGCNGCIFIQMQKRAKDPGPVEIVQHMMRTAASGQKHMSRFILRVLPIEATSYASEEEITQSIKPIIAQHFPEDAQKAHKYAVLFESRANTGIDRMKIINAVAKCVPVPHKVDLSHPDKTIIVEVAKTICLVGVIEKYKEMAKYNLRQLTSTKSSNIK